MSGRRCVQREEQVLRQLDEQQEDVLNRGDEDEVQELEGPSWDLTADDSPPVVFFLRVEESPTNRVGRQSGAPQELQDKDKDLFVYRASVTALALRTCHGRDRPCAQRGVHQQRQ